MFPSLWFQMPFYFLVFVFLSCTCHFLSCSFICLWSLCLSFWEKKRISTDISVYRFIFVHDLPCLLMFLFSFLLLPTFFYFFFTLLYFNAFHFLPLSFHVRYFPCPSIICSYPFIVPPCHVQNFIDRIFGMRDRGRHGGHTLYVCEYWKTIIHTYKNISFRGRAISLSFLFTFLWSVFIFISVLVKWGVGSVECWVWSE